MAAAAPKGGSGAGFLSRLRQTLRSIMGFHLHPVPTAPDFLQYPTSFRLPYSRTPYAPDAVPLKESSDLSTIAYWKHAAGKRRAPVPRKPDVLKQLEKEGTATRRTHVADFEDIAHLRITRTPSTSPSSSLTLFSQTAASPRRLSRSAEDQVEHGALRALPVIVG